MLHYKIATPTILDFEKVYLKAVLNIVESDLRTQSTTNQLIFKMSVYLGKMVAHDYHLSGKIPSLVAIACLYVAFKICEQLKYTTLING